MPTDIPQTMKAAVLIGFGGPDVVQIASRPVPSIKPDQVLVKTLAATVNSGDARIRAKNVPRGFGPVMSLVFGFNTPRIQILGTAFAGEIVAVGETAQGYQVGDRVFGSTEMKMGTHAEYIAINSNAALSHVPSELSPEDAVSLVFGGTTAMYFSQKTALRQGERILINGAAGSVGIALTQIAHAQGAHVTAVASAKNHSFLKKIGANACIDYTTTNLSGLDETFDVIADCPGTLPYSGHRHLLFKGGRFALITGTLADTLKAPLQSAIGPHKIIGGTALATNSSMAELTRLVSRGTLAPIIDKTFAFDDIQSAYAYVDTGHKRGNVVLTF